MKPRIWLLAGICIALPALAAESPQSILSQDKVIERAQRRDLADSFLVALDKFSSSFLTLTPEEQDYVETELSEAKGARRTQLINSKEYLIYEIRNDMNQLRRHLNRLKEPALPRNLEMKHWAAASYHLLNSINENFLRLREMGAVQSGAMFPMWTNYYGKQILVKAIAEP